MVKVGISVFAYNRNVHLSKTLEGLKQNKEVEEIYVFQDGLKSELHRNGWEATKKVISDIDWCKVKYVLSDKNKGLAKSIVDGVNHVLAENDAIIVLEDDCVPTPNYICFMLQCFEKYYDNMRVYSVSGYSLPIAMERDDYDIYFAGRMSSWGWGTWKNRWRYYASDNGILDRIKHDQYKSASLAMWGNDLENMLFANLEGKVNSWAVYWALKAIEFNGVCVYPYASLIHNIGCDGSGVNCGKFDRFEVDLDKGEKHQFILKDDITFRRELISGIIKLKGGSTVINNDKIQRKLLIYGLGNFFKVNEEYINRYGYIEAFIDRVKEGYYAGRKIIKLQQITSYDYDEIVIMMQNINECINVAKLLENNYNVERSKIRIAGGKYESWFSNE